MVSILKKPLKVMLWVALSFVLLFIMIAGLIQIPAIQTKITGYAISFVSSKTHTAVNVKNISIAFPKSVVIEGLFVEDIKKDTLLFAEKIKVNIAIKDLLNNEIHLSSIALEEVDLFLNRTKKDSLFNFNFLLTAFSDTAKRTKVDNSAKSKWTFNVDNVGLKNIRFRFDDEFGGITAAINLRHLTLKMDQIDLAKSIYRIDNLIVEGLTTDVLIKKISVANAKKSARDLPMITANTIEINQSNISFTDSIGKQSVIAAINRLELENASLDLQKEFITLDNLYVSKSEISYNTADSAAASDTTIATYNTKKSNWKVTVKHIDIDDNSLAYNVLNKPELKNTFDVSHLNYSQLTLEATGLFYSADKTTASIKKFTTVDQHNFAINQFETEFTMDQHSITAKKLIAETTHSAIEADLNVKFSSLNAFKDSLEFIVLEVDMKNVRVTNSDIIYFVPQLAGQQFFKNEANFTTISGYVYGPVNDISGENIAIKTGTSTDVKTDFTIKGLPTFKTAWFNFPNLRINSGRKDIALIAGSVIPDSIELPENIDLEIIFKGQIKAFESKVKMNSSYGSASVSASIDKNENFNSHLSITNFDVGSLLMNKKMFGPVTLIAETNGKGLDKQTIEAKIKVEASEIYLNQYVYHDLNIDGAITGQIFEGKINLNDENAVFDLEGLVNLNHHEEQYIFNLNLHGADLQKLHFTNDDIRVSLIAQSDLKGSSVNELNGKVGINKIIIAHEKKTYVLDSFLLATINEPRNNELSFSSALIGIKYNGTLSPVNLPKEINRFINNYFPFSEVDTAQINSEAQQFNFEVQLHNHPIISELLLPQLKEFDAGLIQGSFDSGKNELKLKATINKIVYGTTEIKGLLVDVNSDVNALNYNISSSRISTTQINLDNFLVEGKFEDNSIMANVSSMDEKKNKKLFIRSQITKDGTNYKLMLDPNDFYLMNDRWDIAADNYIEFGKQGLLIHHLFLNKTENQLNIASVHDQFNDDLDIEIKNFKLDDFSKIIEKDTSLVKGIVDGKLLLKRVNNAYGIVADVKISKLIVREVPVGNLSVKAENPTAEKFELDVNLSGAENNVTATGYFIPKGGDNSININAAIQSLSLKTVEAFSMGTITKTSGNITGNILVDGRSDSPDITGELTFNNAFLKPAVLNNLIQLKHETVQIKKDGIYLNSFTLLDSTQHKAIIQGNIKMEHFKNFIFDLQVNSKDFLLFNTTAKVNEEFFGRMIIDSKIYINGPINSPVINASVKMKEGSNFTFAVPEKNLTNDKGEGVVEFDNSLQFNPILYRNDKKVKQKSGLKGFDISATIEIDKKATLRLLMDPASADSLVVKGEALLDFAMDRSGKMSLTGAYTLHEGSYLVSLESVVKRKFDIKDGGTIIWNGDPLDAEISIDAVYSVRAAPIDLVADQLTGLSEADKNTYKQRFMFLVLLKLRGPILRPEISFEIQLPPEDKGILGGAVNAKLIVLNEDQSALNKQVFALLVLGRFIQENPLQTESNNGVSTVVRESVGKFLSAQLNRMSSKMVPGVDLNFDIRSYDDYQTGQAQGRTQVDIGLKKQLFNERLSVQVGGAVDVEGVRAKENSVSEIASDITVEYKLTKDGRYRLKGFTHNQYEGVIEGQLVETGIGVKYVRDFNKWKDFFRKPKEQK
jgi:hypothetical protein